MTARNKQVALTSASYPASTNSKVPVFLQKLYKIVSDPSTNDEICWSESGDSFFVHDQERLSKILGHWFKHNKFASFVRQLNMYGFHKIPHLQQGVMKSDSDAERSQFAHPDFHRDQEDRLIFIERKKQVASNGKEQGIVDFPSLPTQPATQAPTDPSTGQALDIHAIVNGISAIRRHQANISTELSELKRSNQLLWQESMDARSRHQKQQDTINKIIKFLGSLFTTHASPAGKEKERGPASHSVVRGSRLMIEDKKRDVVPKVGIVEVQDEDAVSLISRDGSPRPFASIETPGSTTSLSPHPSPGEIITPSPTPYFDLTSPSSEQPLTPFADAAPSPQNSIISTQPRYPGFDTTQPDDGPPSFSPSRSPIDERLQTALNFLTPGDIQALFTSLSNHIQGFPGDSADLNSLQQTAQSNQLPSTSSSQTVIPSKAPFDFGLFPPQISSGGPQRTLNGADELISFDAPYMEQWDKASDIEEEVNSMNCGIDKLIHELGLDPTFISDMEGNQVGGGDFDASVLDTSLPSSGMPTVDPATQDDLFNSFMNTFPSPDSSGAVDFGDDVVRDMASLDPVKPSEEIPASTTSPTDITSATSKDLGGVSTRSQKRKSTTGAEVPISISSSPKTKKRKDK